MVISGKTSLWRLIFLGKPIGLLGKTCCLFGAYWSCWPLLRLRSAADPVQFSLGKISAPSVGRCQEKPFLGKNLVLASLFRGNPSLVGCCSRSVFGRFLLLWWVVVRKNPLWGKKNLFLSALLQENPLVWEQPVLSSVLIGVGRHFLFFILYRSSGDFCVGKTHLGKNL